ncbi:MAG: DUF4345 domain-containing protein [Gammaproteobacteria bacterium]|nr:DUF4345 domain-containing protein [Gammaproteobacteria bacterium]
MKNSNVLKAILFVSGVIIIGIGAAILFTPVAFYAKDGIELGGNISLLNEIRASAGGLLAMGIWVMLGIFVRKLTFTSTLISIVIYLSYGLSRVLSMIIDGMPTGELVGAAAIEIIIGLVCVFALLKYREK